jgi:hypothetical protein
MTVQVSTSRGIPVDEDEVSTQSGALARSIIGTSWPS